MDFVQLGKILRITPVLKITFMEILSDLLPFRHLRCYSAPALKKHGLDSVTFSIINNYRPISNLSYIPVKDPGEAGINAVHNVISYLNEHDLLPAHQSGSVLDIHNNIIIIFNLITRRESDNEIESQA